MCEITEREFNKDMLWNLILTVITIGIFSLVWMARLSNRNSKLLKKEEKGWLHVILTIITCGLYLIYWNYKMGEDLRSLGVKISGTKTLILAIFTLGKGNLVVYDKEMFILENGNFKKEEILSNKEVRYQNGEDTKISSTGFSWTTFFFFGYPAIFRRDYDNAVKLSGIGFVLFILFRLFSNFAALSISLAAQTAYLTTTDIIGILIMYIGIYLIITCIIRLILGFIYNRMHQKSLERSGYRKV